MEISPLPVLLHKECLCRELRGSAGAELISHAVLGVGLCSAFFNNNRKNTRKYLLGVSLFMTAFIILYVANLF